MNAKQDSDLVSLQKLVDSFPGFIFTNRPDGYLDYCNQSMLEYLGVPFEALEGWRWGAVVHSDDVAEFTARWQASLASGEPFLGEAILGCCMLVLRSVAEGVCSEAFRDQTFATTVSSRYRLCAQPVSMRASIAPAIG